MMRRIKTAYRTLLASMTDQPLTYSQEAYCPIARGAMSVSLAWRKLRNQRIGPGHGAIESGDIERVHNKKCRYAAGWRDREIGEVALQSAALLQDQWPIAGRHVDDPAQAHRIHRPGIIQADD